MGVNGAPLVMEITRLVREAVSSHEAMVFSLLTLERTQRVAQTANHISLLDWNRGTRSFIREYTTLIIASVPYFTLDEMIRLEKVRQVLFQSSNVAMADTPDMLEAKVMKFIFDLITVPENRGKPDTKENIVNARLNARHHDQTLGHNVHILEQYPTSTRESEAAGLSVGLSGQEFLTKHDRIQEVPHFVTASNLRTLDAELKVIWERKVPFKLTNWKTLYYRLRSNFDGLRSEYVPEAPQKLPSEGSIIYDVGKRVLDVSYAEDSGLTVTFKDVENGQSGKLHPDLIIAADGASSGIRKLLYPTLQAQYSGYLTWRGVLLEIDVSEETRNLLHDNCVRYTNDRNLIILYIIPGENGSITPGERHINLVWYHNCTLDSPEFINIMTDTNGIKHQRTVPFGKVQPEVWAKHLQDHSTNFAAPIKEVLHKISSPFVTAISDIISPCASFDDGKLFLVGDALALFQPPLAQSTNQAALHCLLLEKFLRGQITLQEYEGQALEYGRGTLLRSRAFGAEYLDSDEGYMRHKLKHEEFLRTKRWESRFPLSIIRDSHRHKKYPPINQHWLPHRMLKLPPKPQNTSKIIINAHRSITATISLVVVEKEPPRLIQAAFVRNNLIYLKDIYAVAYHAVAVVVANVPCDTVWYREGLLVRCELYAAVADVLLL
ncbi:hypothetical protein G7Y89_g11711 [Cudoniella acicularis]|uniref:2,6-dihydroxypyridine 3-monooxygenase substrate binding domain-containing protein n=1 Tax=Cudoniella acicularis TaxID=354080 RepID=A0A8H4RCM3_9HELO|nr:hypothetical protein G7Y89_g11711 [Cudoniella acicularis]